MSIHRMIEGVRCAPAQGAITVAWLVLLVALSAPVFAQAPETAQAAEPAAEAAGTDPESPDESAPSEADAASDPDAPPKPQRSPGMYLPFDGSSIEAFEGSLDTIKGDVTDAEFVTLLNALDYLLVYDLGARGDPELLYKRLDGKTPDDVLSMVKWRQEGLPRVRGRTKPEVKADTEAET
ncbi:MAG: hypothetical protein R3212_04455 [Xanthomonadales bacterium]|nr:hypothetical protein [Xanthomonadales bacterium]